MTFCYNYSRIIHCLLTLCVTMRLKKVCKVLSLAFYFCKLTAIKSKDTHLARNSSK